MNYNQIRHLELLKRLQDFEKQGKSIYIENQKDYLELLDYNSATLEHILWKSRHEFILLIENFINGVIDGEEFSDKLSALYNENIDAYNAFKTDLEKLEDFQPDLESNGFGNLINFLRSECEDFEPDSTFVELNIVRESDNYTEE